MKHINRLLSDLSYLSRCLKATTLTLFGHIVVYAVLIEGAYRFQYVSDFRKVFGIIVLGVQRPYQASKHYMEGLIEFKKVPSQILPYSIHVVNSTMRCNK